MTFASLVRPLRVAASKQPLATSSVQQRCLCSSPVRSASGGSSFRGSSYHAGGVPYTLHAHCSDNNTILTLSHDSPKGPHWHTEAEKQVAGKVVARVTGGMAGFKKGQRGTFEAAAGATSAMLQRIEDIQDPKVPQDGRPVARRNRNASPRISDLTIALNGFGQGREALYAALTSAEGQLARQNLKKLQDVTPLKIGGGRPRKRRVL